MRRIALLILVLLTVPATALADPPAVTPVPAPEPEKWVKIDAPAGRLFVLSAEPASKWRVVSRPATVADLRVFENGKMYVGELMCPPKDNWRVGSKCPPRKKKKLPTESAPDSAGPGPSSG